MCAVRSWWVLCFVAVPGVLLFVSVFVFFFCGVVVVSLCWCCGVVVFLFVSGFVVQGCCLVSISFWGSSLCHFFGFVGRQHSVTIIFDWVLCCSGLGKEASSKVVFNRYYVVCSGGCWLLGCGSFTLLLALLMNSLFFEFRFPLSSSAWAGLSQDCADSGVVVRLDGGQWNILSLLLPSGVACELMLLASDTCVCSCASLTDFWFLAEFLVGPDGFVRSCVPGGVA